MSDNKKGSGGGGSIWENFAEEAINAGVLPTEPAQTAVDAALGNSGSGGSKSDKK